MPDVRQCLLSQAQRAHFFARVRHGLSSSANAGCPHIPPLFGAQRHLPIPPIPRELGAFPSSRRHRCQPGRRRPSPFAAQALLGRSPHAAGRSSLSRNLCAPPFSGPSFQSLPLWGGTGGAPLPPRAPLRDSAPAFISPSFHQTPCLTTRAADFASLRSLAADAAVSHRLLPRVHRASRASPAGPAHLQMPARSEG